MRLSSQMKPEGARSDLLLDICRSLGPGTTFLGGMGGSRHYLDQEAFASAMEKSQRRPRRSRFRRRPR